MTVSVIFTSKELEDVDGFVTQVVSERPNKPESQPQSNDASPPLEPKEEKPETG